MRPLETLRADTPHGELVLQLRGGARPGAALFLAGSILMDSDLAASERELARRGLAALEEARQSDGAPGGEARESGDGPGEAMGGAPRRARGCSVLVAGLGLGLTLEELLSLRGVGRIEVVEIFAPLVDWNRGPLAPLNGRALADPRVGVRVGDLREFLEADLRGAARYDLLLLDIDNGPTWLSLAGNSWLYEREGLERLRAHTAPRGVIAFWATEASAPFEDVLRRTAWGAWRRETIRCPLGDGQRVLEYTLYLLRLRA